MRVNREGAVTRGSSGKRVNVSADGWAGLLCSDEGRIGGMTKRMQNKHSVGE